MKGNQMQHSISSERLLQDHDRVAKGSICITSPHSAESLQESDPVAALGEGEGP